jgi:hypothetical protein
MPFVPMQQSYHAFADIDVNCRFQSIQSYGYQLKNYFCIVATTFFFSLSAIDYTLPHRPGKIQWIKHTQEKGYERTAQEGTTKGANRCALWCVYNLYTDSGLYKVKIYYRELTQQLQVIKHKSTSKAINVAVLVKHESIITVYRG